MTEQQAAAYVQAQATAAMIEAEGMKAQNRIAEIREEYPPFDGGDFTDLIEKYGLGHNTILSLFQGCIN